MASMLLGSTASISTVPLPPYSTAGTFPARRMRREAFLPSSVLFSASMTMSFDTLCSSRFLDEKAADGRAVVYAKNRLSQQLGHRLHLDARLLRGLRADRDGIGDE